MDQAENDLRLPFRESHAFIIGINQYQHVSNLMTAVKDAVDIASLLEDKDKHGYRVHLFKNAGKAQMEEVFQLMKDVVQEDDRVLFYFAGHGIALDSEGDPEGFLVPADAKADDKATLISMDVLHQALSNLPCKHGLLILDCCFAGAFKWSTGYRFMEGTGLEVLYAERFWRFVQHPAWQVITSSAHDQKAADLVNKQALGLREEADAVLDDNNSPFAFALKQALDLHSKADTSGYKRSDGVITVTELYLYLREIVEQSTHGSGKRQSPAIFTLGKHDFKGEYIFINPGHRLNLPEAPSRNPYKGLGSYETSKADAETFFGRDAAIRRMTEKLARTSILLVTAPSGQGKSSVVKAGLFPQLQKMGYESLVSLRPGDRNFTAWEALPQLDLSKKQVLLIDQYEEMFALKEEERIYFEQLLQEILSGLQQTKLIITIRSDFEWQLKTSALGESFWQEQLIRDFLYRLPPMTSEELREAMVKPAWVVAYEFESEELINQILEEINHAPGALPLLSFTLHKLFEERNRNQRLMTKKAYQETLGGVNGALSKYADSIYLGLPEEAHQDFMRKLMLRMVRLNDGSYSRRRVYLRQWSNVEAEGFIDELNYPDHLDETKDEVLKILGDALLLSNGEDQFGPYVEPMHDSLINFWPRCLKWIQDFGRENLVLQRDLWKAVIEYHQWQKGGYGTPDGKEPQAPLWDNNPKLQQVQIAITDPNDEWLCKKGWANKSISSIAYLLWERAPNEEQLDEMKAWNWFFQTDEPVERYQKIQGQMDHWLNEEELEFVKQSFELQRSELERLKAERDEARKGEERAIRVAKFFREKSRENYNAALVHLRQLLRLADDNPNFDVYRIEEPQLYFLLGDKKQSALILDRLIEHSTDINKLLYLFRMAIFYLSNNELEGAISYFKKWILDHTTEEGVSQKCQIVIQQLRGKSQEALVETLLQQLLESSEDEKEKAELFRLLAEFYEKASRAEDAITAIQVALSHADILGYHSFLGKLFVKSGFPEKGKSVFLDLIKRKGIAETEKHFLIPNDPNSIVRVARQEKYIFVTDGEAIARFKLHRKGFFFFGSQQVNDFISQSFPFILENTTLSAPIINILSIVVKNHGRFDSINTWDSHFLSFGIGQWTMGGTDKPGELPVLLSKIQQRNPAVFERWFGQYGVGISEKTGAMTGYLTMNGEEVNTAELKETFRQVQWGFLFWKAAHDPWVKAIQLEHYLNRIKSFYWRKSPTIKGRCMAQIITSEYGVAQIWDMHFNRPGYLNNCIQRAIDQTGLTDPDSWTTTEENQVLEAFLTIRQTYGNNPMTNAKKRGDMIKEYLNLGLLSDERNTFLEGYNQRKEN